MSSGSELGRVHVITGPGKGKTTAAFGLAMRASGHGLRVCIVQFMKTGETTGEVSSAKNLKDVEVSQFGTGRFIGPGGPTEDDRACARKALEHAKTRLSSEKCDLLILDEINTAVHFDLLEPEEVLSMVASRGGTEVVLTGRNAPAEFLDHADYVSYIDNVKHPFDRDQKARKGIEW